MNWKLYYDDGSTYAGEWEDAPQHGVICCVVRDTTEAWGRFVNSGYAPHHARKPIEFFVCYPDSNEPFVTWSLAPFRNRMKSLFPGETQNQYIKYGRQTEQLNWEAIMNVAAADTDFPTATSPRRRSSDFPSV